MVRLALALAFLIGASGCGRRAEPVAVAPAPAEPPPVDPVPVLAGEFAGKSLTDWDAEIRSGDDKRRGLGLSAAYAMGAKAVPLIPAILDLPATVEPTPTWAFEPAGPAAVPVLVAALKSGTPLARYRAVNVLVHLDPVPPAVVPALVAAVGSDDPLVLERVLAWAEKVGPVAKDAGPALVQRLDDPNRATRESAAHALAAVDPGREPVKAATVLLAPWTEHVTRHIDYERQQRSFRKLGPATVPALDVAAGRVDGESWRLVWTSAIGVGPPAVGVMAGMLRHPLLGERHQLWIPGDFDFDYRTSAAVAKDSLPVLVAIAKDPKSPGRSAAWRVLAKIGATELEPLAVDVIKSDLKSNERPGAFEALGWLGSEKVIPLAIAEVAADPAERAPYSREAALNALGRLAPKAADRIVPVLKKCLTEFESPEMAKFFELERSRVSIARALVPLTPDDPEVYKPWLRYATGNWSYGDVTTELDAEVRQLGPKAVPALRRLLTHRDPKLRLKAAFGILLLLPADDPALTVFSESVMTADECRLFGRLAKPAADRVAAFVGDEIPGVRTAAVSVIAARGPAGSSCVPALVAQLKIEKRWQIGYEIRNVLVNMGPAAKAAAPYFVARLDSPARDSAAVALAAVDPGNPAGVPVLLKLAREQPEAAEALYRTAPELAVREGIIFPKKPLRRFDGPAVQIAPR